DFDVELSPAVEKSEIERIGRFFILGDGPQTRCPHGFVKDPLPIGNQLRMRNHGIFGAEFRVRRRSGLLEGKTARIFGEARKVTDSRVERGLPVTDHHQLRTGSGNRYIKQVTVALQKSERAFSHSQGHNGREKDHVALIALESVDGIDYE